MALRPRALLALAALAVALAAAAAARAEVVVRQDAAGRTITFDVLAPAVDVDWYAGILAAAAHGDEIGQVTVRIVAPEEIETRCGADAAACYERRRGVSTITLPVGRSPALAGIVLHEYGHHLDASRPVAGVAELNGTPAWWAARGVGALLSSDAVAFDYSLGWERSIGEVFAEDYAYIHGGGHYAIPWLEPPDEALQEAMFAELGRPAPGTSPEAPPPAEQPLEAEPVLAARSGVLAPRGRVAIPFRVLGAGGRVTVTGTVARVGRGRAAARLEIVCGKAVVGRADVRRSATIDLPGLGPSSCRAAVISTSSSRQRYALRLRLAPIR